MANEVRVIDNSSIVKSAAADQILKALETCGLLGEGYAKMNITEQHAVDTGLLRNSISHKVVTSEKSVYIGTNVEYAPYVEYGTGIYAEKGNGRQTAWTYVDANGVGHKTRGMKARPYLRPAVSKHVSDYKNAVKEILKG